jgi:hypothetical protein
MANSRDDTTDENDQCCNFRCRIARDAARTHTHNHHHSCSAGEDNNSRHDELMDHEEAAGSGYRAKQRKCAYAANCSGLIFTVSMLAINPDRCTT